MGRRDLQIGHPVPELQDLPPADRRRVRQRLMIARRLYLLGESPAHVGGSFQARDQVPGRLSRLFGLIAPAPPQRPQRHERANLQYSTVLLLEVQSPAGVRPSNQDSQKGTNRAPAGSMGDDHGAITSAGRPIIGGPSLDQTARQLTGILPSR